MSFVEIVIRPILVAAVIGGCMRAKNEERVIVRDSAGVRIVEHKTLQPFDVPVITIPAEPVRSVGSTVGASPDQELFFVNGAALLDDDRLLVVNAGTQEIRYYGPDGSLLTSVGRAGDGPGEFRTPELAGLLPGDSALVYDDRHRRFTVLDPDGRFARSYQLEGGPYLLEPVGVVPGVGAVMFSGDDFYVTLEERLTQDTTPVTLVGLAGDVVRTLGEYPAATFYHGPAGHRPAAVLVPLWPRTHVAAGPSGIYVSEGTRFEIARLDPKGAPQLLIRSLEARQPVPDDYFEKRILAIEERLTPDVARGYRYLLERIPRVDLLPPHGPMLVARDGALWVLETKQDELGTRFWIVFDADSSIRARMRAPLGILEDAGRDFIVLSRADSLGLQTVSVHRF